MRGKVERNPSAANSCPGCGSSSFAADLKGAPVCEYCRAAYLPPTGACQGCGSAYEPDGRWCPACGVELARDCPACGALIPLATGQCLVCGQPLDVVDAMFTRLLRTTPDRLRRVRQAGATIKAQEEAASEARLAKMWAEDERRRQELAHARAERLRRERLGVALVVGVGVIVVVMAVVIASLAAGSAPGPLCLR